MLHSKKTKPSIHEGLVDAEARDFLAREYDELYNKTSQDVDHLTEQLTKYQRLVDEHKALIKVALERDAVQMVANRKGWLIHELDPDDSYVSFVGNNFEYEDWCEKSSSEEEAQIFIENEDD